MATTDMLTKYNRTTLLLPLQLQLQIIIRRRRHNHVEDENVLGAGIFKGAKSVNAYENVVDAWSKPLAKADPSEYCAVLPELT
jgi:hypothetical protein